MYLEPQFEQRRNFLPTAFVLAMVLPAVLFWAWTGVRGSTRVNFEDALDTRHLARTVSPTCRTQSTRSKFYFDCFDQIGLLEEASSTAILAQKPLMVIFGRENCDSCEELERLLDLGTSSSDLDSANAYRDVANQVLQVRLVRYKPEAKEIARELGVEKRALAERGRLYAPYIMFYDPASGRTSHVKWSDHSGLDPDRLGLALRKRLGEI